MTCTIREAQPADAAAMLDYLRDLAAEPGIDLPLRPEEVTWTLEEERTTVQRYHDRDNAIFLLALAGDGQIVGMLNANGGQRQANRHVATLGVSVRQGWRDQGVGTALMQAALDWARGTGIIRRVDLQVFTRNARAIHLYEKLGFVLEGVHRRAYYVDGAWVDDQTMALLLD